MKLCVNCKTQLEDDELFCHECGTKQVIEEISVKDEEYSTLQEKKCIHCGEMIESDSTFCPFCGKSQIIENIKEKSKIEIERSESKDKSEQEETLTQNYNKQMSSDVISEEHDLKKWLIIAVGVLTVSLLIGGIYYWNVDENKSLMTEASDNERTVKNEDVSDVDNSNKNQSKHYDELITFDNIIKTNGDFDELVKKHGFKYVEFQNEEARFPSSYYYKNCVVRNKEVIPSPEKGTPIRIDVQGTMTATDYVIEVFSDDVFKLLTDDFLSHVKSQEGNEYTFYWADGHVAKYASISSKQDGEGGSILIVVPFTPWEEMEE